MSLRSVATAFGVVGGLCWVVRYFSDRELLEPAGLILLGIASAAAGAALVNKSAVPLRVLVAVWSVLDLVRDAGPDRSIDAGFGAAAVVSAVVVWLRRPVSSGRHAPGRTRDAAHRGE